MSFTVSLLLSEAYGSPQLLDARVLLIPQDKCKEPHVYGTSLDDSMFCAGNMRGGIDSCQVCSFFSPLRAAFAILRNVHVSSRVMLLLFVPAGWLWWPPGLRAWRCPLRGGRGELGRRLRQEVQAWCLRQRGKVCWLDRRTFAVIATQKWQKY